MHKPLSILRCVMVYYIQLFSRNCRDVKAVSRLSESLLIKVDLKHMNTVIETLTSRVAHLRDARKGEQRTLTNSYKHAVQEIKKLREHFSRVLERLESQTLDELDIVYKDYNEKILEDVKKCDREIASLRKKAEELNSRRARDELRGHIVQSECETKVAEAEKLIRDLEGTDFKINFRPDKSIDEFMTGLKVLGKVEEPYRSLMSILDSGLQLDTKRLVSSPLHSYQVKYLENHNVLVKDDVEICYITGCCQLPDGQFVLVDCSNSRVKLVNDKFNVISYVNVPNFAQDVCCLTDLEVAVTINNSRENVHEIQFISVNNKRLHLGRKFTLTHDCDGIAHHADRLYVSSWDALYVYSTSGRFIEKLYEDKSEGSDTTVYRIAISDDGYRIYVTNVESDSLVTLDHNGYVLSTLTDPDLRKPSGVCVASGGQVFVAGESSNCILQVDREGERKLATVATYVEGLKVPQALCFDRHACSLIASQDKNDTLLVMHMK